MLRIAIDGACRRNGKPDCVSAGGVFVMHYDDDLKLTHAHTMTGYEVNSTSQRGELQALLMALDSVNMSKQDAQIITDSEYLFNTVTKEWYKNWERKGWVTAANEPVKNRDMWEKISIAIYMCPADITIYHIKGHCIPFGKVTASNLLDTDGTGLALLKAVDAKYDQVKDSKSDNILKATQLSEKNNGFALEDEQLKAFIVANVVADAIATRCIDALSLIN